MKGQKLHPGDYGYINYKKKRQLCIVLIWAVIIGGVIAAGWLFTGTRMNVATVVGIVLVLPAAKAAVSLFLVLGYRSGDKKQYEKIRSLTGEHSIVLADLILTRYEGSMYIPIALIRGGNIFAFAPKQKTDEAIIRQYIGESVKASGSTAVPCVDRDFNAFYQRLKKMPPVKAGPSKSDKAICTDILSRAV